MVSSDDTVAAPAEDPFLTQPVTLGEMMTDMAKRAPGHHSAIQNRELLTPSGGEGKLHGPQGEVACRTYRVSLSGARWLLACKTPLALEGNFEFDA
jgi:hypothetical protein